jgi:hypothetical protein
LMLFGDEPFDVRADLSVIHEIGTLRAGSCLLLP